MGIFPVGMCIRLKIFLRAENHDRDIYLVALKFFSHLSPKI